MEVINWVALGGLLVDLVIISIIVSTSFWGYRRGLVSVMFKVLVFICSIIIMFLLYKPVSKAIINKTQLDEKLATSIEQSLMGTTLADGKLIEAEQTNISDGLINIINSFVKDALKKSEENAVNYVSVQLAYFMIRVGTMLILFFIARTLLLFVRFAAELISTLPIIRTFNRSGGLVYGIIRGFLTAYAILAIISVLSPVISNLGIVEAIEDSHIGNSMYNHNFILSIISSILNK